MDLKNRKALLTNSDGTLSTEMDIVIDDAIPITHIADKIIETQTIKNFTVDNTAPSNLLKDIDGNDRYVFLVRGYKDYNDISINIFYDTENEDYIMISDIDYYDLSIKRFGIKIRGKRVGSIGEMNRNVSTTGNLTKLLSPSKNDDIDNVDLITLNLHCFYNKEDGKMSYTLPNNDNFRKDINAVTFMKVDKNTLFGTDAVLPLYVVEPGDSSKFVNNYVGDQNTDYIYIIIPN